MTVREALALGTPCVASDVSARPEGTIVFRAGDPVDLAGKLIQAFDGPRRVFRGPDAAEFLLRMYGSLLGEERPSEVESRVSATS
jgi:glycosyltransferase involved in cell wall biosynthesis